MKCGSCHRPITDPKSVERGYGPACWRAKYPEGTLGEDEFAQWIFENYTIDFNPMAREPVENVLDYAGELNDKEQQAFLRRVIPEVPDSVIRSVRYGKGEKA